MKTAIFAFSGKGLETARAVSEVQGIGEVCVYTVRRLIEDGSENGSSVTGAGIAPVPQPSGPFYGEMFAFYLFILCTFHIYS